MNLTLSIAVVAGYLLGALPFGYLVARAKGVNIFEVGSKNPGATNVRRVLGAGPGNLVLFLDAAKGAVATGWPLLVGGAEMQLPQIAGLVAAILGHGFSCFTGFRGGKSVATAGGGFVVLFPAGIGVAVVVFGLTLGLTRYVSLSSMLAAVAVVIASVLFRQSLPVIAASIGVGAFVIFRHRANISRLLAGTESKIGQKAAPPSPAGEAKP